MKKILMSVLTFASMQYAFACAYCAPENSFDINWSNPNAALAHGYLFRLKNNLRNNMEGALQNPKMKAKYEASRPREKTSDEENPIYVKYRKSLSEYKEEISSHRDFYWEDSGNAGIAISKFMSCVAEFQNLKGKISPQLFEYELGAIKYVEKKYDEAKKHFENALNMPETVRKMEAAFMVMRSLQKKNPKSEEVLIAYKNVEKLFDEGCPDPQNLAFESDGYLAMWHLARAEYFEALQIYFDRYAIINLSDLKNREYTGIVWGESEESLMIALKKCVKVNLEKMASNPVFAELATSYLVSGRNPYDKSDLILLWVEILEKKGLSFKPFGGKIAFALYNAGEYEKAEKVLSLADENEPLSRWVKSKFLIRNEDYKAAAQIISDLIKNYSDGSLAKFKEDEFFFWGFLPNGFCLRSNDGKFNSERHLVLGNIENKAPMRSRLIAEYGLLKFNLQDKIGAMECFFNADYYLDAAYICEKVLTLGELKSYADANIEDKSPKANFVRAILTLRILKEENSLENARKYFSGDKKYVEFMETFADAMKIANDKSKPAEIRAVANWEIFTLYCEGAAEMFLEFYDSGSPEYRYETRAAPKYLYTAFDHALKAADLMPDKSLAARMYVSSHWKLKNPEYIQIAYKNLCKRCRGTKEGEYAWKNHWMPKEKENPRAVLEDLKKIYPYKQL